MVTAKDIRKYIKYVSYLLSWTLWKSFPKIFTAKQSRKKIKLKDITTEKNQILAT